MSAIRLARIIGRSDRCGLTCFSVQFKGIPADFGLDGRRLRGQGPHFYLHQVVGCKNGARPEDLKEFGPRGLTIGTTVSCVVSRITPAGFISAVRPPKKRAK